MVSQGGTRKPASFSLVTSFARHHCNHLDHLDHHLDHDHLGHEHLPEQVARLGAVGGDMKSVAPVCQY